MEKIIDFLKKIGSFIFALVVGFVSALLFRGGVRDNRERTESAGDRLDSVSNEVRECGKEVRAFREEIIDARRSVESGISIIEKVRARKRIDN